MPGDVSLQVRTQPLSAPIAAARPSFSDAYAQSWQSTMAGSKLEQTGRILFNMTGIGALADIALVAYRHSRETAAVGAGAQPASPARLGQQGADPARLQPGRPVTVPKHADAAAAKAFLQDLRTSLQTDKGTVRSGYLSLQTSKDGEATLESRSRFYPSGDKAGAATRVRQLLNQAYGEKIANMDVVSRSHLNEAIDTYLAAKGGKMGTASFVKLLDTLEAAGTGSGASGAAPARGSIGIEGSRLNFREQALTQQEQAGLNAYRDNPQAYQIRERAPAANPQSDNARPAKPAGAPLSPSLHDAVGRTLTQHQTALNSPTSALAPWRRSVELNQFATLAQAPVANGQDPHAANSKTMAGLEALILAQIPGLPPGAPGGLAALDHLPPELMASPAGMALAFVGQTAKGLRALVDADAALVRSQAGAQAASEHLEGTGIEKLAERADECLAKLGDGQGLTGAALETFNRLKGEASALRDQIQASSQARDSRLERDNEPMDPDAALDADVAVPDDVQALRDLRDELQGTLDELHGSLMSLDNPAQTKAELSKQIGLLNAMGAAGTNLGETTKEALRLLGPLIREGPAGGEADALQAKIKEGHMLFKLMDSGLIELTPENVAEAMTAFDAVRELQALGRGNDQATVKPMRDFVAELISPRTLSGSGDASRLLDVCNRHLPLLQQLAERPDLLNHAGVPPQLSQGLNQFIDDNRHFILLGALPPTDDLMAPLAEAIDSSVATFEPTFLAEQLKLTNPDTQKHQFLGRIFGEYYAKSDLQDQKAMLASLLRECPDNGAARSPQDHQQAQMLALVKGAGPLLQKYLQQYAESFADPSVQTLMKAVKRDLAPIPAELRNAALAEIIENSRRQGRPIADISNLRELGAASIAQAFKMTLNYADGRTPASEEVVVKLVRPGLAQRAAREEAVLSGIAAYSDAMKTEFHDFAADVQDEMLMKKEHANLARADMFNGSLFGSLGASVSIQAVRTHPSAGASDSSVMMEIAPGETMSDALSAQGIPHPNPNDPAAVLAHLRQVITKEYGECNPANIRAHLEKGAKLQEAMIAVSEKWFEEGLLGSGFFHGDMHGGNIMFATEGNDAQGRPVNPNGQVTMIDFGNAHQLEQKHKEVLMGIFVGLTGGKPDYVMSNLQRLLPPEAAALLNEPHPSNLGALLAGLQPNTIRDSAATALGEQVPALLGSVVDDLPNLGGVDLAKLAAAVNTSAGKFAENCDRWSSNTGDIPARTVFDEISAFTSGRKGTNPQIQAMKNHREAAKALNAAQALPDNDPNKAACLEAATMISTEASRVLGGFQRLTAMTNDSSNPAGGKIPALIHAHMCGSPNATRNEMLVSSLQKEASSGPPGKRMDSASRTLESIVDALNTYNIALPPAFSKFVKSQGMLDRAINQLGESNRQTLNLLPVDQHRPGEADQYSRNFYSILKPITRNVVNGITISRLLGPQGREIVADIQAQERAAQA